MPPSFAICLPATLASQGTPSCGYALTDPSLLESGFYTTSTTTSRPLLAANPSDPEVLLHSHLLECPTTEFKQPAAGPQMPFKPTFARTPSCSKPSSGADPHSRTFRAYLTLDAVHIAAGALIPFFSIPVSLTTHTTYSTFTVLRHQFYAHDALPARRRDSSSLLRSVSTSSWLVAV
jgi:hypothetical protein